MRELPGPAAAPAAEGRTGGARRVAAVAVLLAVTAAGLQARGTFSHGSNSTAVTTSGAILAIVLSAAEGMAFIAFIVVLVSVRPQRLVKDTEDESWRPHLPWWAKALGVLLAVGALVTPFAVLFSQKTRKPIPRPPPAVAPAGRLGRLTPPAPGQAWPLIVGMAIAIVVVLALTLLARRRRAAVQPRERVNRLAGLLEALTAGSDALSAGGQPREAIIACYAAMERGFAAAGSAPAAADTPAEVLSRATRAGIIRSGSAEVLTGLFRRARYSSQPMTRADSGAAATALARLRADLTEHADLRPEGARS